MRRAPEPANLARSETATMLTSLRSRLGGFFWGRTFEGGSLRSWMHEPVIRRYINESVTGSADQWPIEWLAQRLEGRTFRRAISLGCGDGALERDLLRKGICTQVLGVDISRRAIAKAKRAVAEQPELAGVSYVVGDLNRLSLPTGFDAAFFHQSLHHVECLDACLAAVASALHPGAMVYLDEYIGPARGEWRRQLLADAEALFVQLPPGVRRSQRLGLPVDWR